MTRPHHSTRRLITASGLVVSCLLLLFSPPAAAQRCSEFDGAEYTYPHMTLPERVFVTAAVAPTSMTTWDAGDWSVFGAFSSTIVGLMPGRPSLDVRVQRWVQGFRSDTGDDIFVRISTPAGTAGFLAYAVVMGTAGWAFDRPDIIEYTSLAIEAVAITQFYHIVAKVLLGRDGPSQEDQMGTFHGPRQVPFPSGTPSGHTGTIYAMLTVAAEYYDSTALRVLTHVVGVYAGASLIYKNQHFLSEVIWGAATGYFIGRWVVRHHSSRYRCGEPIGSYTTWMPLALDGHGFGLAIVGTF